MARDESGVEKDVLESGCRFVQNSEYVENKIEIRYLSVSYKQLCRGFSYSL